MVNIQKRGKIKEIQIYKAKPQGNAAMKVVIIRLN